MFNPKIKQSGLKPKLLLLFSCLFLAALFIPSAQSLTDTEKLGTTEFSIYAETSFTETITLNQNSSLITHNMPYGEVNSHDQQFESSSVAVSMSDFSTRSYVSEDFSDLATFTEDVYSWTNTTQNLTHSCNFDDYNQSLENINTTLTTAITLNRTGNFLANQSFSSDTIGGNPGGWTIDQEDANTHCDIAHKEGHNKTIEVWDNTNTGKVAFHHTWTATQIEGTLEFWTYGIPGTTSQFLMSLRSTTAIGAYLWFDWDTSLLKYYYNADWHDIGGINLESWIHIRVFFNCTSDTFDIWLNGTLEGEDLNFLNVQTNLDNLYFTSSSANAYGNFYQYLDAIDYSWASDYETERSRFNNSYYSEGSYLAKPALLSGGDYQTYYQTLVFTNTSSSGDSSVSIQWRDSDDNSSWDAWSSASTSNITINANHSQYFQYCVNLTASSDTYSSPRVDLINFSYEERNRTIVDTYTGNGIIKSWSDYSNYTNSLFMNISASCINERLKLSILSDSNNKSVILWNNTNEHSFFTNGYEFIVIDLNSDYGITFIENITFTGNIGEYWNSIIIHQNISGTQDYTVINCSAGIIQKSDESFYYRTINKSEYVSSTCVYGLEMGGRFYPETLKNLWLNITFRTKSLYPPGTYNLIWIGLVFQNLTSYDAKGIFFVYNSSQIPLSNSSYSDYTYICSPLITNTEYLIFVNYSSIFESIFGISISDHPDGFDSYYWWIDFLAPDIEIDYIALHEGRSSSDISINGTSGDQSISTSGLSNILNFSTSISTVQFTYSATYSLSYSGSYEWTWPSFVFTYKQYNQSVVFVNTTYTDLPPWYSLYYPDALVYYLITALNDSDVQDFLTSTTDGVLTSTIFQTYRGNATIAEGGAWNFLLIVELRDSEGGFNEEVPPETPLALSVTIGFIVFLVILIIGVSTFSLFQRRPSINLPTPSNSLSSKDQNRYTKLKQQFGRFKQASKSTIGNLRKEVEGERALNKQIQSQTQKAEQQVTNLSKQVSKVEELNATLKNTIAEKTRHLKYYTQEAPKEVQKVVNTHLSEGMNWLFGKAETVSEKVQSLSNNIKETVSNGMKSSEQKVKTFVDDTQTTIKKIFKRGR